MKVSIITPIYDMTEQKFVQSMASVIDQTEENWEWVLVVDGTTTLPTELYDLLRDYEFNSEKRKLCFLAENYGPSVARNVGFQLSDGDVITYLDLGDLLNPDRVFHVNYVFSEFPETKLLFDDYWIKQGENVRRYSLFDITAKYEADVRGLLEKGNISTPLGVSHTRDIFVQNGGFQPGIVCGEDGILWRRMVERLEDKEIFISEFNAGVYFIEPDSQARTQRRFEMGGFAFNAKDPQGSHGQSLDKDWYMSYNSRMLMDK